MGIGLGGFNTDSKTEQFSQAATGPVTASQGTAQSVQIGPGGGERLVQLAGAVNLDQNAQLGGLRFGHISGGSTINITAAAEDDSGAVIADSLERAIQAQANTTAAAISSLGALTPGSPPPLPAKPAQPLPLAPILTGSAAVASLALFLGVVAFAFKR